MHIEKRTQLYISSVDKDGEEKVYKMHTSNYKKILVFLLAIPLGIVVSSVARALDTEDAIGGMKLLISSGSCGPESVMAEEICEIGQGLICLNSPPRSVAEDYAIIKGTVDKRTSIFSHIRAYVQHEYTKSFAEVKMENVANTDCWNNAWSSSYHACIDSKGFFGIKVPLSELGPYTIMIDAVSLDGKAQSKTIITSRVTAPKIAKENITINPDPFKEGGALQASRVVVSVDLLQDCKFCDFIGTSTGGVMLTVTNLVDSLDGGTKKIVRKGNIASSGKYDICLPTLPGKNNLSVSACNAASGDECSVVQGYSFDVSTNRAAINIVSPIETNLIYDAAEFKTIPLKFSVTNYEHPAGACKEGDVQVSWNRYAPVSLCPDDSGFYGAKLVPHSGVNIGTISVKTKDASVSQSFVVGWGSKVNPYNDDNLGWVNNGVNVTLGADYLNDEVRSNINSVLASGDMNGLINDIFSQTTKESKASGVNQAAIDKIKKEIPFCSDDGLEGIGMELIGQPELRTGELQRLAFGSDGIGFKLNLQDLNIRLRFFRDENNDKKPDGSTIPILVSFRALQVEGKLQFKPDGKELVLLGSKHTNCDYQSSIYCEEKPALIIPKNIVGGATRGGAFIRCDNKGQQIDSDMKGYCTGFNVLNSQTGLVASTVLAAINDIIYCDGSAMITHLMREGLQNVTTSTPEFMGGRQLWFNAGIKPLKGRFEVNKNGLAIDAPARFGSKNILYRMDPVVQGNSVGVLFDPASPAKSKSVASSDKGSFSLSMDLINELLFQLAFQREGQGILDWDIDKFFFDKLGFDFVKECDAFDPTAEIPVPSSTCQMRPRVGELLGTALSVNGYLGGKDPIHIKLKGSREIAPHIKIYRTDVPYELPSEEGDEEIRYEYRPADVLEMQVPEVEVSFYALELDKSAGKDIYGNPEILLDADGKAIIRSMLKGSKTPVPIITFKTTILLALEIKGITTFVDDPSKLELVFRPIPMYTKMVFKSVEGGNSTMVPDVSLLSAFREKISYGVEIYGKPGAPVSIKIPKEFALGGSGSTDLFKRFGLEQLSFGADGLQLKMDPPGNRLTINLKPIIK